MPNIHFVTYFAVQGNTLSGLYLGLGKI